MFDFIRCKKCALMRMATAVLVLALAFLVLTGCTDYELFIDDASLETSSESINDASGATDSTEPAVTSDATQMSSEDSAQSTADSENTTTSAEASSEASVETPVAEADMQRATIMAAGDIMFHSPQYEYAGSLKEGTYDFSASFAHIKQLFQDADLAIGNFESVINDEKEPNGYPYFNTPSEAMRDIRAIGFDILGHANNHTIDGDLEGVFTTRKAMEANGIVGFGTNITGHDPLVTMDVNGIKIAFLAYTYGLNGNEWMMTQEEIDTHINLLNPEKIEKDIKAARQVADFVIVYPHWGQEYKTGYTAEQESLGRNMVEWGADAVIGSHPHVVEPAERYRASDGRTGLIMYSMGNFISGQFKEVMGGDPNPERGLALELHIVKNPQTKKTEIEQVIFHPMWMRRTKENVGSLMELFPVEEFRDGGQYVGQLSEADIARGLGAYEYVMERMHVVDSGIDQVPFALPEAQPEVESSSNN